MKEKRHIAFVLGRMGIGGTERVTVTLANAFAQRGWQVTVVAFAFMPESLAEAFDLSVAKYELSFPAFSWKNFVKLRRILVEGKVDYIINQWALPFPVSLLLHWAKRGTAKLIAFHHTVPNRNGRVAGMSRLKTVLWRLATSTSLRLVYDLSDAYGVLSESYRSVFEEFTGVRKARKLFAITNPVPRLPRKGLAKENVILFVGRLTHAEKRVDRVLAVWGRLSEQLPDWRLEIVGDGPDRPSLEVAAEGLPRVKFLGYQSPAEYYERGKILLLTSDFEGFVLVLVEAMGLGCVPVVYGSFGSVYDIIGREGSNGIVVPTPWDEERFAGEVLHLATDEGRRASMSEQGVRSADRFDVDLIVQRYVEMLEGL